MLSVFCGTVQRFSGIRADYFWAVLALSLVGKLGPTGAFTTVYVFSMELFPTVLRNAGLGASSCVARFGGMAAPYVAQMVILILHRFCESPFYLALPSQLCNTF